MHRRQWLAIAMVVVGASLLIAASFASASTSGKALKKGGIFRYGLVGASTQVDPQLAYVTTAWSLEYATAAKLYVGICTAVWSGVHATNLKQEVVACGATDPRGNNSGKNLRPSISPLAFLAWLKKFGLKHFDVYAHHPYYSRPAETPSTKPKAKTVVTLGNIGELTKLLTKLYGNKKLWITEYGYQTSPPDRTFGVSWAKQAKYLTQAYSIARRNPRITMMLWFLLRDEGRLGGWQSGLFTAAGKKKPSYNAFRRLPH